MDGSEMTAKQQKLLDTYEHLSDTQIRLHISLNEEIASEAQGIVARLKKLQKLRKKYESENQEDA